MDDSKIVDLYLARDEQAVAETRKRYGHSLRTLSMNITEDLSDAEECENSTYMEAWNSIPPHEPRTYLFPFLARIARNISLDICRKRSAHKRNAVIVELPQELEACIPAEPGEDSVVDDMAIREALNQFLSALSEQQRVIFMRRYFFADPISTIADRMGLSESNVKTTLHRCREKFRGFLSKEGITL